MSQPGFSEGPVKYTPKNHVESAPILNNKEVKRFTVIIDGEQRSYPENYPYQFLIHGSLKDIGPGPGSGMENPDKQKLNKALDNFLAPAQEVFKDPNNPPEWYTKFLEPVIQQQNLDLNKLYAGNYDNVGKNYRDALEELWNFPFPKEAQYAAAKAMGQIEGKVPSLSALIEEMKKNNPEDFAKLMKNLLEKGPDGFTLAAWLAKEEPENNLNLDKVVSFGPDGKPKIDPDQSQKIIDAAYQHTREGFDQGTDNNKESLLPPDPTDIFAYKAFVELREKFVKYDQFGRLIFDLYTRDRFGKYSPNDKEFIKAFDAVLKQLRYQPENSAAIEAINKMNEKYIDRSSGQPRINTKKLHEEFVQHTQYKLFLDSVLHRKNAYFVTQEMYEDNPVLPTEPMSETGLARALGVLWNIYIPGDMPKMLQETAGQDLKLGNILQYLFKDESSNFKELTFNLMSASREGYTIADTLVRYVYGMKAPSGSSAENRTIQQQDIPQAIQKLLDYPLPKHILRAPDARAPFLGVMLSRLSQEEKQKFLATFADSTIIGQIIGFESTHQNERFLKSVTVPRESLWKKWLSEHRNKRTETPKLGFFTQKEIDRIIKESHKQLENMIRTKAAMEQLAKQEPSPMGPTKLKQATRIIKTEQGEKTVLDINMINNAVYEMMHYLSEGRNMFPQRKEDNLFSPAHIRYFQQRLASGESLDDIEEAVNSLARALIQGSQ